MTLDQELHEHLKRVAQRLHAAGDDLRQYHTWTHIETATQARDWLAAAAGLDSGCPLDLAEDVALLFHDVVYVSGTSPGLNELLSAQLLQNAAHLWASGANQPFQPLSLDGNLEATELCRVEPPAQAALLDLIPYAAAWIAHTTLKWHLNDNVGFSPSLQRILDADMYALQFDPDRFDWTQEQLVGESDPDWWRLTLTQRHARLRATALFLQGFASKTQIFRSPGAQEWEARARANIDRFGLKYGVHPARFSVIDTDNLGSDYPNEKLIVDGLTKRQAQQQALELNQSKQGGNRFYKVEPSGYSLLPGFEP